MPGRLGTFQEFPSAVLCVLTTLGELRVHAFPITLRVHASQPYCRTALRAIALQMRGHVAFVCERYCGRKPYSTTCP